MKTSTALKIWFIISVIVLTSVFVLTRITKAATFPQYSYGVYASDNQKIYAWFESNKTDQKTNQDLITGDSAPSIVDVFNLLGAEGWHYVNADHQGSLTLYMFERPLGG